MLKRRNLVASSDSSQAQRNAGSDFDMEGSVLQRVVIALKASCPLKVQSESGPEKFGGDNCI
jgi:hypothetical protein